MDLRDPRDPITTRNQAQAFFDRLLGQLLRGPSAGEDEHAPYRPGVFVARDRATRTPLAHRRTVNRRRNRAARQARRANR